MLGFLAVARPVVIQVQEGSGGASIESILVFVGGVMAAIAAVGAALLTTRGAEKRLKLSLGAERQRFDRQLDAESQRIETRFAHERYLAQRAEAGLTVEQVGRLVARTVTRVSDLVSVILDGKSPNSKDLDAFTEELDELQEELNILVIRFGQKSPIAKSMAALLKALNAAFPSVDETPLSEERKVEIKDCLKKVNSAESEFLGAAKRTLEDY